MTADEHVTSSRAHAPRPGDRWTAPPRPARAPHRRRRARLLPALAGVAVAAALVGGCGTDETEVPDEATGTDGAEQTSAAEDSTEPTTAPEDDDPADDGGDSDDGGSDGDSSDGDGGSDDGGDDASHPAGENLFEGSWGFGHDEKKLDAQQLADLLEEEAEARGPEEMSLDVECEDGVDTSVADDTAQCTAYADEGVEHPWRITVGPADAGLEIEVENTD